MMRTPVRAETCLAIALAVTIAACGDQPTAPTPPVPPPPPSLFTLSGTVFETTAAGRRPIPSAWIFYDYRRPNETFTTGGGHRTDAEGRFSFPHVLSGTRFNLRGDSGALAQPCGATAVVTADTELNVELVPRGTSPANRTPPRLSGLVFETTPQGRRPAPLLRLAYNNNCRGLFVPYGWTDAEGRYDFCNLPVGNGCLLITVVEDEGGNVEKLVPVEIRGDQVLDVDISR